MDITPAVIHASQRRSRSRSRTRNSTANSRSTSSSRRPSLGRRTLSSSSLTKLAITPTSLDGETAVPSVNATLDNTLPVDFFKQDIWALVKTLRISKWHKKNLDPNCIAVNRISGALTNSIYKVEYKDKEDRIRIPTLLLRVYGKNVDSIIDRDAELDILIKLSQRRIGPKLLGIFTNGRFEQFLDGFITLNKEQIRDEIISQILGRRMKELHYKVDLNSSDYEAGLPMCWKLIDKWMNIFEETILPTFAPNGIKEEEVFLSSFKDFKVLVYSYRDWLFSKYETEGFSANFKFCHNDTQYGNLLLHESFNRDDVIISSGVSLSSRVSAMSNVSEEIKNTSNKKDNSLVVIDFEYSGANFPAFDLVNHMCEWMADYHHPTSSYFLDEKRYPTKVEQLNFIKSYIEYDFQFPSSNLKAPQVDLNKVTAAEILNLEIKKMNNECVLWRSSVQIYWLLWGLIQNGPIKTVDPVDILDSSQEERGVEGTYKITTGVSAIELDENVLVEDEISSSDDNFDYLKYSQQKAGLMMGDLIGLGLIEESDLPLSSRKLVKYLDCQYLD